jgi:hypothetical protein
MARRMVLVVKDDPALREIVTEMLLMPKSADADKHKRA